MGTTFARILRRARPCIFAIRPEKCDDSTPPPGKARKRPPTRCAGRILDIAYLGNISTYHVETALRGIFMKAQAANTRPHRPAPLHLGGRGLAQLDRETAGVLLKA